MPELTLEQRRAQYAWEKAKEDCSKDYLNLAKGLPALIMNSGLMQVMAFLHKKGKAHHLKLQADILSWLHEIFDDVPPSFTGFMEAMLQADSRKYQDVTTEALAWLRWMRQMAAARCKDKEN